MFEREKGDMEKILTITIPAYNVEKYLSRCVDSLLIERNFEKLDILIVDDGSKDRTAEIADEYEKKYPDSIRVIHKENGGHGSGINTGIAYAKGKYFKVLDGDDWLNTKELPEYIDLLTQLEVDMVASDFSCIEDESYRVLQEKRVASDETLYGTTRYLSKKAQVPEVIKMHSLSIKTSILQEHQIVIDENSFYVDMEYITYPIPWVETVYYDKRFLYQYRLGRNGQSMDIYSMQKNQAQHRQVMEHMLENYEAVKASISPQHCYYMEKSIAQMVESHFQIYLSLGAGQENKKSLVAFDQAIKKNYPRVYQAVSKKTIWLIRKSGYLLFGLGAFVYKKTRM